VRSPVLTASIHTSVVHLVARPVPYATKLHYNNLAWNQPKAMLSCQHVCNIVSSLCFHSNWMCAVVSDIQLAVVLFVLKVIDWFHFVSAILLTVLSRTWFGVLCFSVQCIHNLTVIFLVYLKFVYYGMCKSVEFWTQFLVVGSLDALFLSLINLCFVHFSGPHLDKYYH